MHIAYGKKFLLASKSSSRQRLLKSAGLSFQTAIPNCDEDYIKIQLLKTLTLYMQKTGLVLRIMES